MPLPHLFFAAGLAIVTPAFAEPEPAAKQAMEAMAQAVTNAKALSYQVEIKGVGLFEMLPSIKCEVIAARAEASNAWRMRVTGRSEAMNTEPTEILLVADGNKRSWLDYPAKVLMERNTPDLGAVNQAANSAAIREVFEPSPFSRELKSPNMKMEPQVELDGVKCDVVFIDPGQDLTKTRYAIATTDRIPRRVEIIIEGGGVNGRSVALLTKVKVNDMPPEGVFTIAKPEGFGISAAPVAATPAPVTPTATPSTPPPPSRPIGTNIGEQAPDFDLSTPDGEKIKLYSLRGQVCLVDFWGSWHPPCRKSTAVLQKIADSYKGKPVKVFGLAVREGTEATPVKFFKDNNLTYTLLLKGDDAAKAYRVRKYPMLFVIGKEGEVVYSVAGYDEQNAKDITDAIERALAAGAKLDPTGGDRTKAQQGADDSADR